jgi:transcriptional regulator with GAF, ATPase, and Fis domain
MRPMSAPEIRQQWLWGLSACLLIGLSVTVAVLGKSSVQAGQSVVLPMATFQVVLAGLVGLVVLFVLHVTMQQWRLRQWENEIRQRTMREEVLRARLSELAAMLEVSGELSQKLDLRATLELAAHRLLPCLEADHSSILLLNPRAHVLEQAASVGKRATIEHLAPIHPGAGVLGHVFASREMLTVEAPEARAALGRELGLAGTPCSAMCVPILFEGACLGVFCVARVDVSEPFTALHARALQVLASQCGAAIVRFFHTRRGSRGPALAA